MKKGGVRSTTPCGVSMVSKKGQSMRMLTTGAAAGLALLLAGGVTAAPAPKTMVFNLTTVTDARGMHVNVPAKVWVKGQKARVEANEPMAGPTIRLVNGSQVHTL